MSRSGKHRAQGTLLVWILGAGFLGAFLATAFLVQQVIADLERQRSASSDNVQWTLTQVEVDYLTFVATLERRGLPPGILDQGPPDLDAIRRQFDIFYSRIETLRRSRLFANLREDPAFATPLATVRGFLVDAVPIIDAPDATLPPALAPLWREALGIERAVRDMSVAGLAYFAQVSDQRRAKTARTLVRLAAFSGGLLLALAGLSLFLLRVNRRTRKRGREIRQTNQRMNTILSTSLDAVIVVNAAGEVLEFNPAAEAIFGHTLAEAKGKSIGDLIVPPHLRDAHSAGMKRMQTGGDRHVVGKGRVQLEAMRADGTIFPVELALQSAFAGDEEIVIGFVRDISRRVQDERDLIEARDRALAGEKAKADFLTVMSHEIRTPLNGLLGNLTLLKTANPTREQKQYIRNMDISGQILLNHVDSVLDIARFEAGKLSIAQDPTDLGALIQDIVDGQSGNAASRGNALTWAWVGEARPWVAADTGRLRQVLLNLVGNAIKFTENGHVGIEVERSEPGAPGGPDIYEIRVIDTGIGIPEANHDAVFEDFHTADPSTTRATGGTGLGLGIARRFVTAMGGEIGVESTPGEGSVFWVRLPLRPTASPSDTGTARAARARATGLDLLVVEDNEINLEVICNMLRMDGHKVTVARNGKDGADTASVHRFDAILMDISMPVMDGPAAARLIRSGQGASRDVPIIAVSANVLPQAVAGFREAGMDAFIGKPISLEGLRKALAGVSGTESPAEDGRQDPLTDLRRDLGGEAFARLLARFLQEGDALVAGLAGFGRGDADLKALGDACHKLAGSAAMFGAEDMRTHLIEVEMLAKDKGGDGDIDAALHRVRGAWTRTRKGLEAPGAS